MPTVDGLCAGALIVIVSYKPTRDINQQELSAIEKLQAIES